MVTFSAKAAVSSSVFQYGIFCPLSTAEVQMLCKHKVGSSNLSVGTNILGIMKTIICWYDSEVIGVQFFVVPGDQRDLENHYIGTYEADNPEYNERVSRLQYMILKADGTYLQEPFQYFPHYEMYEKESTVVVITAGIVL